MAELKTTKNRKSVEKFLSAIENEQRKTDCFDLLELMKKTTGEEPAMWGDSIVGFGSYHYKYKSGREGDWPLTGFSPRKQYLTIYIMSGFEPFTEIMTQLGKYKTGASCLYVKKLDDIDTEKLQQVIKKSVRIMKLNHPG